MPQSELHPTVDAHKHSIQLVISTVLQLIHDKCVKSETHKLLQQLRLPHRIVVWILLKPQLLSHNLANSK